MKKYVILALTILLVGLLTACGNADGGAAIKNEGQDAPRQSAAEQKQQQKILIAYFTRADNSVVKDAGAVQVDAVSSASLLAPGNTAKMAMLIQSKVGGDLFSIKVQNPYPESYEECLERAADEAAANARPALANRVEDFQSYDVIFLGYPNWSYSCPMAVLSFLESYDLQGKKIIPFVSHGTGGLSASVRVLQRAVPGAEFAAPLGIYREDMPQAAEKIEAWLQQMGY